jgi:hypothetical protein
MRIWKVIGALILLIAACAEKPHPEAEPEVVVAPAPVAPGVGPLAFPPVDDNISHDTLLIQTTFDLRDGTYIMVASHMQVEERLDAGDRDAGVRLYHYRLNEHGAPDILAVSSSAGDSWTMFPTFFNDPVRSDAMIILANLGERSSWGQKVIRFDANGFQDLGFLDLAAIERVVHEDEVDTKLLKIAPHTRVTAEENDLIFKFTSDEVHLYDDQRGTLDQAIAGDRITYRWKAADGMVLHVDGEARPKQEPS